MMKRIIIRILDKLGCEDRARVFLGRWRAFLRKFLERLGVFAYGVVRLCPPGTKRLAESINLYFQQRFDIGDFNSSASGLAGQLENAIRNSKALLTQMQIDTGPVVVFNNPRGNPPHIAHEVLMAYILALRSAKPKFLLCWNLPICPNMNIDYPGNLRECLSCRNFNTLILQKGLLEYDNISDFLKPGIRRQAQRFAKQWNATNYREATYKDIPVGELVSGSIRKYYRAIDIGGFCDAQQTVRKFLTSAIILIEAYTNYLRVTKPATFITNNGLLLWDRVALAVGKKEGVEMLFWEDVFLLGRMHHGFFVMGRNKPAVTLKFDSLWERFQNVPLSEKQKMRIDDVMKDRFYTTDYYSVQESQPEALAKELGIDTSQKIIVLYANAVWDTASMCRDIIFDNPFQWVNETIQFVKDKSWTLIIKTHPAETYFPYYKTRRTFTSEIEKVFSSLPENVRLISPESAISPITLAKMSSLVVVYGTTVGMEAAYLDKPVIVVGDFHFRRKGFTFDPSSKAEYFRMIEELLNCSGLSHAQQEMLLRYLYFIFLRCHYHLDWFKYREGTMSEVVGFKFDSLQLFLPGKSVYVDLWADQILNHKDFIVTESAIQTLESFLEKKRPNLLNNQKG